MVPKVTFRGFGGVICIEMWFQNFDSGTQSATGTHDMAKKNLKYDAN